jgi:hypothetical protein
MTTALTGTMKVALAKELHAQRMSLRKIAAELAVRGHLPAYGKPYVASAVQSSSDECRASTAPAAICGALRPIGLGRAQFFGQGRPTEFRGGIHPCARNEKYGWDPPFLIPAKKF